MISSVSLLYTEAFDVGDLFFEKNKRNTLNKDARFSSDLFCQLNVFPTTMRPLREAKEDIVLLVYTISSKYAKSTAREVDSISVKALKVMMSYNWPGNLRELEYMVERILLTETGNRINDIELPAHIRFVLKKYW